MLKNFNPFNKKNHNNTIYPKELKELNLSGYVYSSNDAIEELGLDKELIEQLVEDYVIQIIKSLSQFDEYLYQLEKDNAARRPLEYTPFRDLVHKNLGVARNLRIEDGEKILNDLMKKDDLEYLRICLEGLRLSAIALSPKCANDTLTLLHVKSNF